MKYLFYGQTDSSNRKTIHAVGQSSRLSIFQCAAKKKEKKKNRIVINIKIGKKRWAQKYLPCYVTMWGWRTVGVRAVRAIEPKLVLDSIITNYRLHRARARLFPLQCTNYS